MSNDIFDSSVFSARSSIEEVDDELPLEYELAKSQDDSFVERSFSFH